ncbi:MAG: T9SS type A sorting domain-containing protein [Spirosomataceae bacterium]
MVVPKNSNPTLGRGLVQVYAVRADSLADAAGGNDKIWVGGEKIKSDIKPPTLQMYLNNESFVEGSQVEDSPLFIAKLTDENGLNTLQNMTLTLNDTFSVVVNDYFLADKDSYQHGTLRYLFSKLPQGEYTLKLKVADTYNNWIEGTLKFRIGNQVRLISRVVAYPNPFMEQTQLQVELLNEGEDIEIEARIFDLNGRILHTSNQTYYNSDKLIEVLTWNGTNHYHQILPAGIYVYKLLVRSVTRQHLQVVGGKLIKPK